MFGLSSIFSALGGEKDENYVNNLSSPNYSSNKQVGVVSTPLTSPPSFSRNSISPNASNIGIGVCSQCKKFKDMILKSRTIVQDLAKELELIKKENGALKADINSKQSHIEEKEKEADMFREKYNKLELDITKLLLDTKRFYDNQSNVQQLEMLGSFPWGSFSLFDSFECSWSWKFQDQNEKSHHFKLNKNSTRSTSAAPSALPSTTDSFFERLNEIESQLQKDIAFLSLDDEIQNSDNLIEKQHFQAVLSYSDSIALQEENHMLGKLLHEYQERINQLRQQHENDRLSWNVRDRWQTMWIEDVKMTICDMLEGCHPNTSVNYADQSRLIPSLNHVSCNQSTIEECLRIIYAQEVVAHKQHAIQQHC